MTPPSHTIRHGFADTSRGQMHYVTAGQPSDPAVVLLHQSPRSVDEYRDVIPLLARNHRVLAIDSLGFGWSIRPEHAASIEEMAAAAVEVIRAVLPDRPAHLVGHHTGGVVAVEIAASEPSMTASLVLSAVPWVDAPRRKLVASRTPIDFVERSTDGSHLLALWRKREPYYPADRPDLLERLLIDQLSVIDRVEAGHLAVNAYRMEDRVALVNAPALVVCGALDSFSLPDMEPLAAALPRCIGQRILPGVGVPAVDHDPEQFAAVVSAHIASLTADNGGEST
jgi:pimeloyl-ACP methyl ester carboxylesterase